MITVTGVYDPGSGAGAAGIVYAAEETETADDSDLQSSFEYKKYRSHKTYRSILKIKMPDVYKKITPGMDDDETVPIPGTVTTCASTDGSIKTDTYIPQGICSTGAYWLVTAYDANKQYPSVIYVIDSGAKKLVSTVLLPNRYHVGGIAFDGCYEVGNQVVAAFELIVDLGPLAVDVLLHRDDLVFQADPCAEGDETGDGKTADQYQNGFSHGCFPLIFEPLMDTTGHECLVAGPTIFYRLCLYIMNSECRKVSDSGGSAVVIASRG